VAAAPARSASESWQVIRGLIRDSLARSSQIDLVEVNECLDVIEGFGRQLVAGGHLDKDKSPLTLLAADLDVCFNTVSGDKALGLEENLNFVPGAANATDWKIYLPSPDPLGSVAVVLARKNDHLSTAEPPQPDAAAKSEGALDHAALQEWARGR
jgi:hypothetical protein